jgi:hypothetical protein
LNTWVNQAQGVLAALPTTVVNTLPRPVVSDWTFSNSAAPSMFRLHALTNPPSLPVPYKWVQDVWLEAAQYDYESELAKSPLERGTILIDDRRVDICAALDEEGAIGEVTTTVPNPPGIGVLPPLPVRSVVRTWDSTTSRDPRTKGRSMVSAWGIAEAQLGNRLSGASKVAAASFSFQEPRLMEIFLRCAERLAPGDKRNLSLTDLSGRFQLTARDVQQLKAKSVTNLSSLASSILVAYEFERLAQVQPFPRQGRIPDSIGSRALPPALAHALVRSIGDALDASYKKHERIRPGSRHAHEQRNNRRRKQH